MAPAVPVQREGFQDASGFEIRHAEDSETSVRRRWSACCRHSREGSGSVSEGIRLSQVGSFLCATSMSLASGALFDAYLKVLEGTNLFVGDVETANGMAALATALPVGWLADRWSRINVLRCNGLLGLLGAVALGWAILHDNIPMLFVGSTVMSMHNFTYFSISSALLADMTNAGHERTKVLGDNATMSSLGRASGPALQLLAILVSGREDWTCEELHPILCLGFVIFVPYLVCVWRVQKPDAPSLAAREPLAASTAEAVDTSGCGSCEASAGPPMWKKWLGATLLETGSLVTAVGSGMTFKFWPLFFKGDYGFSPAGVCAMQLAVWVSIALAAQVSPKLARYLGRSRSVILTHYAGCSLMFLISFYKGPAIVVMPLILLRNAVQNSNVPVVQSMIMDLVPSHHRGKWSGIASLRRMTWSGSAFVGGYLSDSHDYRYAFFFTACFHSFSGIFLLLFSLLERSDAQLYELSGGC
ncbi:unnamed protein product [Polarella glacialis]|uniref:Major facilitator superfamily (MFS) profile domain-containing protein n=1 Tax=Polarella glacialis TaxID=89957 RepID=A0A813HUZ8_POLGL|nr:unnamed protein product [Polarella glacialis]